MYWSTNNHSFLSNKNLSPTLPANGLIAEHLQSFIKHFGEHCCGEFNSNSSSLDRHTVPSRRVTMVVNKTLFVQEYQRFFQLRSCFQSSSCTSCRRSHLTNRNHCKQICSPSTSKWNYVHYRCLSCVLTNSNSSWACRRSRRKTTVSFTEASIYTHMILRRRAVGARSRCLDAVASLISMTLRKICQTTLRATSAFFPSAAKGTRSHENPP